MEMIKQAVVDFAMGLTPKFPSQLEGVKTCVCSNPLLNRVTINWKVILMDCSTIIAVTCFVLTFLNGSAFLCAIFALVAISSGVSAFYMRRFEELQDLEETAKGLRETRQRFEALATNLERENTRLTETNRELLRTNEAFRTTNRELLTTNEAFRTTNAQLTQQVTGLTLQVTQLRESAERIRGEVHRFQQENSHLHTNVTGLDQSMRLLDQQILSSRALCDQIASHLTSQQEGLGQQLTQLGQYLSELRSQDSVHQRIQELGTLHQQATQAVGQLHALQIQYAQERGHFEAVHNALVQLRNQFDASMRDAVSSYATNNQQFRDGLAGLSAERQRIQQILNHYFPGTSPGGTQPVPFPLRTGHAIVVN